jgi:putative oxidoreductase
MSNTLTKPSNETRPTGEARHRVGGGRRWLEWLIGTRRDPAALVLRLTLAIVMFPHGAQKLLGWFGGAGFTGTMSFFTDTVGVPLVIGVLVVISEFFGSIALALGAFSRVAAAGVFAVMVGAVLTVHLQNGFFMNWSGAQAGEGFEYHLLAMGIALALVIKGSGAFSFDRLLARKAAGV